MYSVRNSIKSSKAASNGHHRAKPQGTSQPSGSKATGRQKRGQSDHDGNGAVQKHLQLDEITCDSGVQPRVQMDKDTVREYAERLVANDELPPVVVFYDGDKYWLAEGFHRLAAHREAGRKEIECNVYEGDKADAQWHAIQSNKTHGLRRTNEDKQKAVIMALEHPRGAEMADRAIADLVGVSATTVGTYRKELEATVQIGQLTKRTGLDGRMRQLPRIGKTKGKAKPEAKPKAKTPVARNQAREQAAAVDIGTLEADAALSHVQKGLEALDALTQALRTLGLVEVHADALGRIRADLDSYAAEEVAPVAAEFQQETCDRVNSNAGNGRRKRWEA